MVDRADGMSLHLRACEFGQWYTNMLIVVFGFYLQLLRSLQRVHFFTNQPKK